MEKQKLLTLRFSLSFTLALNHTYLSSVLANARLNVISTYFTVMEKYFKTGLPQRLFLALIIHGNKDLKNQSATWFWRWASFSMFTFIFHGGPSLSTYYYATLQNQSSLLGRAWQMRASQIGVLNLISHQTKLDSKKLIG